MSWYVIVYLIGLVLLELRLFYRAGILYGESSRSEREDMLGAVLTAAILLLVWPALAVIGLAVLPFYLLFRVGKKKGDEVRMKNEMWDTLKD